MRICTHCGASIGDQARICPFCGKEVLAKGAVLQEQDFMAPKPVGSPERSENGGFYRQNQNSTPYPNPFYSGEDYRRSPYGGYPREVYEERKTNGFCIASLVLGTVSFFLFLWSITPILGIIYGVLGRSTVKQEPHRYKGSGMALAGIICSVCSIVLYIIAFMTFMAEPEIIGF